MRVESYAAIKLNEVSSVLRGATSKYDVSSREMRRGMQSDKCAADEYTWSVSSISIHTHKTYLEGNARKLPLAAFPEGTGYGHKGASVGSPFTSPFARLDLCHVRGLSGKNALTN